MRSANQTARGAFMTQTSRMMSHQRERVKEKRSEAGRVYRHGRALPFDLGQLRDWLIMLSEGKTGVAWICFYCRVRLVIEDLELDHKEPVKRGGELGFENLAPACKLCNQTKGELTAEEYIALVEGLKTFSRAAEAYILKCLRTAAMGARLRFHPRPPTKPADAAADKDEECF